MLTELSFSVKSKEAFGAQKIISANWRTSLQSLCLWHMRVELTVLACLPQLESLELTCCTLVVPEVSVQVSYVASILASILAH